MPKAVFCQRRLAVHDFLCAVSLDLFCAWLLRAVSGHHIGFFFCRVGEASVTRALFVFKPLHASMVSHRRCCVALRATTKPALFSCWGAEQRLAETGFIEAGSQGLSRRHWSGMFERSLVTEDITVFQVNLGMGNARGSHSIRLFLLSLVNFIQTNLGSKCSVQNLCTTNSLKS